jgi:hypothetical protein
MLKLFFCFSFGHNSGEKKLLGPEAERTHNESFWGQKWFWPNLMIIQDTFKLLKIDKFSDLIDLNCPKRYIRYPTSLNQFDFQTDDIFEAYRVLPWQLMLRKLVCFYLNFEYPLPCMVLSNDLMGLKNNSLLDISTGSLEELL